MLPLVRSALSAKAVRRVHRHLPVRRRFGDRVDDGADSPVFGHARPTPWIRAPGAVRLGSPRSSRALSRADFQVSSD